MKATLLIGFPHAGSIRNYDSPFPAPREDWPSGHMAEVERERLAELGTGTGAGHYLTAHGAEVFTPRVARPDITFNGWAWAGTGRAPSRTSWGILPPDVGNMGMRSGGDITGATGSKAKRARAVGAGDDPEVKRAALFDAWLAADCLAVEGAAAVELLTSAGADERTIRARASVAADEVEAVRKARAALVADILSEASEGQRILALAGGRGYGDGRHQGAFNGGGMASRAARYIKGKRGVEPSATSLNEAAAEAARVMWFEWQCYSALCGDVWNDYTIAHLARYGWRAAFNSFTRDAAQGRTGRESGRDTSRGGNALDMEAAALAVERESLNAWARDRQGRIFDAGNTDEAPDVERRQRKAILAWFADVLGVRAKGRTGAAERARFSMLARLIHGRDIATAARGAGFASGRAAIESFRSGKVWPRLRAALNRRTGAREQRLLGIRARAVKVAMEAINAQRAASAGAGRADLAVAVARAVVVPSGAAAVVRDGKTRNGRKVVRPAYRRTLAVPGLSGRGTVHPLARAWSQATDRRGQAVAVARAARAELVRTRDQRQADFDAGTRKLRAGWLRS